MEVIGKTTSPRGGTRLTSKGLSYAVQQLFSRAGVTDPPCPIYYQNPNRDKPHDIPAILIVPCAADAWQNLLSAPTQSLEWVSAPEIPSVKTVPVLFWGEGYAGGRFPLAELRPDHTLIFYADILAATLFLLTRWEETQSDQRDQHGRFPLQNSVAYKQGFLDRPLVDEYALILRHWLQKLIPSWKPQPRPFSIQLSHDIDTLTQFMPRAGFFTKWGGGRTLTADLLKRRSPAQALQTIGEIYRSHRRPHASQPFTAIQKLAQLSQKYGLLSSFYFMAAEPSEYDRGYSVESPLAKQAVQTVKKYGMEIGFHPGYKTFNHLTQLQEEKIRFEQAFGIKEFGGRQHYLRFQAPTTWHHWAKAGLRYDSTLGFAERAGFRAGTCHPFRPFDLEKDCEIEIEERPLIVMDRTFMAAEYDATPPSEAAQRILALAERAKAVGGHFTLLWHNTSYVGKWATYYEYILSQLSKMS